MNAVPAEVELESVPCPLCGPAPEHVVLTGRDLLHDLPGTFRVVSCESCGLKRTSPRPSAGSIGYYYPAEYGPYQGTVVRPDQTPRHPLAGHLLNLGKRLLGTRAQSLPPLAPGKMLEIGCASGSFLHEMAQRGWTVEGIEFSPEAAQAARSLGYPVTEGALELVDKAEGQYDLVVGWMVLEHLHTPLLALRKLRGWAKPKAKLVLSVPDAGAAEFRIFGSRWYALQVPTHLFHYEPSTIHKVLAAAGWRVVRIQHHRTLANAIASSGYWLREKGAQSIGNALIHFPERGGRLGALLLFPLSCVAAALGQTGRMTVWAERI